MIGGTIEARVLCPAVSPASTHVGFVPDRCRANMAHIRQSRPDTGLGSTNSKAHPLNNIPRNIPPTPSHARKRLNPPTKPPTGGTVEARVLRPAVPVV